MDIITTILAKMTFATYETCKGSCFCLHSLTVAHIMCMRKH